MVGASLGNDVNLRDVEGRSALLLSKSQRQQCELRIGPFLRFFDAAFSLDAVCLSASASYGPDGFRLNERVLHE